MSEELAITYAGMIYDRTQALYRGAIKPEGVDLRYLETSVEDLFWRQGKYHEFDIAEYSFGAYLASVQNPDTPFVAIPVFPSRAFRHGAVYVRSDSNISAADQLANRVIGTPEWSQTASLWMRGILSEHYGLELRSVRWRTGGVEQPGRQEKSSVTPPDGFDVKAIDADQTLAEQLKNGDIDALITARPPAALLQGQSWIRRLFTDYRAEELRFHRRTGVVPIMHVVVVRKALVQAHPWLANNIRDAFEKARLLAGPQLRDSAVCSTSLIWESAYAQEEAAELGDVFAYGVEQNRPTLDTIARYAADQGFTTHPLKPEDLFVASTLTDAKF